MDPHSHGTPAKARRHVHPPPGAQGRRPATRKGAGFLGGLAQIAAMAVADKVLPLLGRKKVPEYQATIWCTGPLEPASVAKVQELHKKYGGKGAKVVGPPDLAWNDVGMMVTTFKFDSQATADAYKAAVEAAEPKVTVAIASLERW